MHAVGLDLLFQVRQDTFLIVSSMLSIAGLPRIRFGRPAMESIEETNGRMVLTVVYRYELVPFSFGTEEAFALCFYPRRHCGVLFIELGNHVVRSRSDL